MYNLLKIKEKNYQLKSWRKMKKENKKIYDSFIGGVELKYRGLRRL